jgi:hypothetical protein
VFALGVVTLFLLQLAPTIIIVVNAKNTFFILEKFKFLSE